MTGSHSFREILSQPPVQALPAPGIMPPDAEVERLLGSLDKAARAAGIGPDDPLAPILATLACLIRVMVERNARSEQAVIEASRNFLKAEELRQQVLQAEVEHLHARTQHTHLRLTQDIGAKIAQDTEKAQTHRVRVLDRNSLFKIAGGIVGTMLVMLGVGYGLGRLTTTGKVNAVVGDVQLSLGNRLIDARALAALAERNSLADEIHACGTAEATTWRDATGRWICSMPVYLDLPPAPSKPLEGIVPRRVPPASMTTSQPVWAFPGAPPNGPVEFRP